MATSFDRADPSDQNDRSDFAPVYQVPAFGFFNPIAVMSN
jgi:hypothetical protein